MKQRLSCINCAGRCCVMREKREYRAALAIVAVALGADFVSGRVLAAFYAQLARASWLGIAVSALLFGGFTALFSRLARRTGARNMLEVLRRVPGGGMGRAVEGLYLAILAGGVCMMVSSAAHVGALALPLRHGSLYAAALCVLLSAALAACGGRAVRLLGGAFLICAAGFVAALLLWGNLPDAALMRWALDLRLEDSWIAALVFALLHASAGVCLSVGTAVRLTDGRMRPRILGLWTGIVYFLLLALGNAVLRVNVREILALKLPFVALAAGWGSRGFYISALMIFLADVTTVTGILYAVFPKHKCPDFIKK